MKLTQILMLMLTMLVLAGCGRQVAENDRWNMLVGELYAEEDFPPDVKVRLAETYRRLFSPGEYDEVRYFVLHPLCSRMQQLSVTTAAEISERVLSGKELPDVPLNSKVEEVLKIQREMFPLNEMDRLFVWVCEQAESQPPPEKRRKRILSASLEFSSAEIAADEELYALCMEQYESDVGRRLGRVLLYLPWIISEDGPAPPKT